MRILVTGGTGLFGNALKDTIPDSPLYDKCEYKYIGRNDCNLLNRKQVSELFGSFKPTQVLHLAARVGGLYANMQDNLGFFESNVLMNMNVLHESYKCDTVVKVLSCMSTCIFPEKAKLPLTVNSLHDGLPHHSNIGYAYAKRMIDVENRILYTKEKPFISIIPTNMFGAHDNFDIETGHVIPALIHKCYLAKKHNIPFVVRGSGKPKRQFLYSKDAARLTWMLLRTYEGIEPVILAPKEEYSISEVVDKIVKHMGYDGSINYVDKDGSNAATDEMDGQKRKTANFTQIAQLFPDFKYTAFDDALKETIDWFLNQKQLSIFVQ